MHRMIAAWAGDAVIHLRIAELGARGHFFQFNEGEPVLATTSLLWTAILTVLYAVAGPSIAPTLAKLLLCTFWCGAVLLIARLAPPRVALLAAAAFALNPGILQNSVNGMEAILLCYLFLSFLLLQRQQGPLWLLGLVSAACCLTRPEGVIFLALFLSHALAQRQTPREQLLWIAGGTLCGLAIYLGITIAATGGLGSDSAQARLAAGLRESHWIGPIHIHTKTVVRFLAYLPITVALWYKRRPFTFAQTLFAAMCIFYTFVVGANHTIRYWIPFLGVIIVAAADAIQDLERRWLAVGATLLAAVYGAEFVSRNGGRPFGYAHTQIVSAVSQRKKFTDEFLRALPASTYPLRVAALEVQLRYFLDDRVKLLSLDGRTSARFDEYLTPRGLRRIDRFLLEERPDYVELGRPDPREPVLFAALNLERKLPAETTFVADHHVFRKLRQPPHSAIEGVVDLRYFLRYLGPARDLSAWSPQ